MGKCVEGRMHTKTTTARMADQKLKKHIKIKEEWQKRSQSNILPVFYYTSFNDWHYDVLRMFEYIRYSRR